MPQYWMITDRDQDGNSLGGDWANATFWVADGQLNQVIPPFILTPPWTKVSVDDFRKALLAAVDAFPLITDPDKQEDQKHVTVFIHGYNNGWADSVLRYKSICDSLFSGADSLGLCILFSWPSKGSPAAYLPDRADAQQAAPDVADVLSEFYDWLLDMQQAALADPLQQCRAKTSIIAHSMGNYVLQKAMRTVWTRKNQPLLVSLVSQLLMVAADVDNDLFGSGETVRVSDGDAIANLTYRVTALYTGRDPILGLSAGLKHFGKRRLGRSGLDRTYPLPDNVWDIDCSTLIPAGAGGIHSSYFEQPDTLKLMRQLLRGIDRKVLIAAGLAPAATTA